MTSSRYAGQWVVEHEGQIVAHSPDAEDALAQVEPAVPATNLRLQFVEDQSGEPLALAPELGELRPLLADLDRPVYLVGGAVRDALLGRVSHDLDLLVPEGAIRLTFRLADQLHYPAYVLDADRDVGRIVLPKDGASIDVARYRGPDLEADLRGRDFTINALALPATAATSASLIDRFDGLADLHRRKIRIIHADTIMEDPVRALRAVRQALQLNFELTEETRRAIDEGGTELSRVSAERVRDELVRLLDGDQPGKAIALLAELELLPVVLPEIAALQGLEQSAPHHEPVLAHTIHVLRRLLGVELAIEGIADGRLRSELSELFAPFRMGLQSHLNRPIDGGLSGRSVLHWAALYHDAGKAVTRSVEEDGRIRFLGHDDAGAGLTRVRLRQLAFSGEAIDQVSTIVAGHMRPLYFTNAGQMPSRRAIYRYFRALGEAGIDVVLLSLADHLATYDGPGEKEAWQRLRELAVVLLTTYFEQNEAVVNPVRLLSGRDLMELLDISGGPEIGRLLAAIEEAQAAGEVTTRQQAEELAQQLHQDQKKTGN